VKRRIHVPELGRHIVIGGCRLPVHPPHGFKLKDFLTAPPPAPTTCDYSAAAMAVIKQIEGNDVLGDCVIAENAHYIAVVTGNSGNGLYSYTTAQTEADYSAITGYNPADPSTDQGTDPIVDLNYRVANGYADGSKDAGWALVDATNKNEVAYAIATFGNLLMWFGIPDSIVNSMPSASGFVWDVNAGAPDGNNGHAIGAAGFNVTKIQTVGVTARGVLVMTWGMLGIITWAAVAAWFSSVNGGGMAVRVTTDWINKQSGKSPSGLNLAALLTAFDTYFGGNLPIPAPTPGPAPTPTTGVTLAQAQAWQAAGINAGHVIMTKAQAAAAGAAGLAARWPKTP